MKHWYSILAGLVLAAGCVPAAATPAPRLEVTSAVAQEGAATPVPVSQLNHCKDSVCLMDVHVLNDSEDLLVIFEVVLIDGTLPPPVDFLLTNDLVIKVSDEKGAQLFSETVAKEDVFCYVGRDAPWSMDRESAACGMMKPLAGLSSPPAVGSAVTVYVPEFTQFLATVTVETAEP